MLHSLFISGNCCTCFGWYLHPSSGAQTTKKNPNILICMRNYISIYIQTRCNVTQFIYIWKLLYMFRVVPPPIIRSANN